MTLKYYFTLFKFGVVLLVLILLLKWGWTVEANKIEIKTLNNELTQEKTMNRYRIEQVGRIASNISKDYQAVGSSINDILVDLKENRMIGIDQKISELPQEMQEIIIQQNIESHGLKNYQMFDEDYIFPVDIQSAYIPAKYGEFGWRPKLFDEKTYEYVYRESIKSNVWVLHNANDIANPYKPEVFASNDGLVIDIGFNRKEGNYIIIEHRIKNELLRQTKYKHLSKIDVKKGDYVKKGKIIGLIGNTGSSTSAHLHFELKEYDGKKWVNKNAFIGTTHKRKWMKGYYYTKNKEGEWVVIVI